MCLGLFQFQNGNFYLTTLCWGFLLQLKSAALLYWQTETETDLSNKLFPHKAVEMEQSIRSITSCLMGGSCFEKGENPNPKLTSMNNTYEVLTTRCGGSANGIISPILLKFTNKAIVLETKRGSFWENILIPFLNISNNRLREIFHQMWASCHTAVESFFSLWPNVGKALDEFKNFFYVG